MVDTTGLRDANLGETVKGTLHGQWGFDPYDGPSFRLRNAHAKNWALADGDSQAVIVGKRDTVHLQADSVSCVDGIMLKDPAGKEVKAEWKAVSQNEVEVTLPLQEAQPGEMTLLVTQFGGQDPDPVALQAFLDAGRFDGFTIHAGDSQGVLKGGSLDEVASLSIGKLVFTPGTVSNPHGGRDSLLMTAQDSAAAAALAQGSSLVAKVTLKDGRSFKLSALVDASRPRVSLIGKSVEPSQSGAASNIQLANQEELPLDARLSFSLRAQVPASFSRDQAIEVATTDESFSTTLNLGNGGLRLSDSRVAVATLDPAKAFGPSAFGPLQFRVISNGVSGEWQPLATLVRLPSLKGLMCPAATDQLCRLSGTDLFLVDSVSTDPQFANPVPVPDGFPGYALPVPRPANGRLYVKLRDDPSVVNQAALTVQALPPPVTAPVSEAPAQAPVPTPAVLPVTPPTQPVQAAPAQQDGTS